MKNLYKITLLCLMVGFVTPSILGQQKIAEKMFSDLRDMDEVTYLSFSKNLLNFVDFDVDCDEDGNEREITGDLKEVKLVIFKPDFKPETSFRNTVMKYLDKGDYSLVEEDENDDDTEVWVHRKGKKVYECHVIFQGEQNGVLLSFFGDFTVKDVDKLKGNIKKYK